MSEENDPYIRDIRGALAGLGSLRPAIARETACIMAEAAGVIWLTARSDEDKCDAITEALFRVRRKFGPAVADQVARALDSALEDIDKEEDMA